MMESQNQRNYGIDFLRLVLMFLVCLQHTLGQGSGLETNGLGIKGMCVLWSFEMIALSAVDGFGFISGYVAKDRPQKYERIAEMWFQVFFYSFVLNLIFLAIGVPSSLTGKDLLESAFPLISKRFWYFKAYFLTFFAMPWLNKALFAIDVPTAKKTFLVMVVLLSVVSCFSDPFRLEGGYTALWIMSLYSFGVLARRIKLFETKSSGTLIVIWAVSLFATLIVVIVFPAAFSIQYTAPMHMLKAMVMVVLFSRLRLKGTLIAKLSPLAFGVYLFQLNYMVWDDYLKNAFIGIGSRGGVAAVASVLCGAAAIFAAGLTVEFIRSRLAQWLRIPALSRWIVERADRGLTRVSGILR